MPIKVFTTEEINAEGFRGDVGMSDLKMASKKKICA